MDKISYVRMSPLFFFLWIFWACGGDNSTTNPTTPTDPTVDLALARQNLAIEVSDTYILPYYQDLKEKSDLLSSALTDFTASLSQENLNLLRLQHKVLWRSWQSAAIFLFGPAETDDIHARINSYPTNIDTIEANISRGIYQLGDATQLAASGLPAIDYLVNYSPESDDVLLDNYRNNQDRLDYIIAITEFTTTEIQKVAQEWLTEPFLTTFKSTASRGTDVGSALGLMVNTLDLHVQQFLRNGKVGIPSGLLSAGITRPENTEAFYGGYSNDLIIESLTAYAELINGTRSTSGSESLSSYLGKINQSELADLIDQKITEALGQVKSLENPLSAQIINNNQPVLDLFIILQELAVLIKSDLASVLGVSITNQDNDGD